MNARQKEYFNFVKASWYLVHEGYECSWLHNDYHGADFLASSEDELLRVQLKGRVTFDNKYIGKNLWIMFFAGDYLYMYEHDIILAEYEQARKYLQEHDTWSTATMSAELHKIVTEKGRLYLAPTETN